jgi:hypothetical protein
MAKLELLGHDSIDATADAVVAPARGCTSLVFVADELVRSTVIRDGQSLSVGRHPPADVVLPEPTVSRQHARFSLEEGVLCVEDTGSHNGVFVNGRAVRQAELSETDRVRIGAIERGTRRGACSTWQSARATPICRCSCSAKREPARK